MSDSFRTYPMAKIRTHSVTKAAVHCMVQRIIFINLPLFPPFAVFVYLRYLKTLRAYFISPNIFMCNNNEHTNRIALASALGS